MLIEKGCGIRIQMQVCLMTKPTPHDLSIMSFFYTLIYFIFIY